MSKLSSIIDRTVSLISPKWSAERRAWRTIENNYSGGVPNRLSDRWSQAQGYRLGSNQDRLDISSAADRALQVYNNNPVARSLVETETDNVIGDGLNYQPASSNQDWNTEAQDRYYEWMDQASVRGPDYSTGCELPRSIWEGSRVSGDIGWIHIASGADSFVQVIPRENIVTPDTMWSDKNVCEGIRFNSVTAPIEYYIKSIDERGTRTFIPINARDFVFLPHISKTKPNQVRGETCYMQVFKLLENIDRYVDGVALAAWMATVFGIVFKQNNSAKQLSALETAYNSAGNLQKTVTLENGMVKYIGTDEDVAQVQAHQPMQQTPDFIRAMLRLAGMVFGMPLEAFARDMSTCNFASARIGLLPFYRLCRIRGQGTFAPRWSRTIRWWLTRESLRAPTDPKRWKTAFPEDFLKHELLSNAWEYTDPVSEVQGDMLQVDAGFKSHQMVISERARDGERILRERSEWQKKAADLPDNRSGLSRHPQLGVGAMGDPLGHKWADPTQQNTDTNPQTPADAGKESA